jgi:hypothetical protein
MIKRKQGVSDNSLLQKLSKSVINPVSFKALNLSIDAELLKAFKARTAQEDISMTEVLTKAIKDYLGRE